MAKNTEHIQHVKSNVVVEGKPKLPQPNNLVEGELAINYANGVETISIKNSNDDIVTFSSDNYYTEQKLGSGFTGDNSGRTVTDALENVHIDVDQVLDDSTSASTNAVSSKAVYSAITDNELVWANAYGAMSGVVSSHTENTNIHVTSSEKTKLDSLTGAVGTMAYEDASSYYDKTEVDAIVSGSNEVEVSSGVTPSGESVEIWIDESVDPLTVDAYTKAEVNALLDGKADTATTYTKDELTGSSAISVAKASSASTAANATSAATAANASTASTALALSASTAATAASGDSVVLKTTGGTYVEIDRDSFAEVMREQLGRLIKGTTDKGTSINGIAAMDASNDLGWVSAANLASVLGVPKVQIVSTSETQITIHKGLYAQALLFTCYNAGFPSIFSINRNAVQAVYTGSVPASSVSVNSNGHVVVQKSSSQILYYNAIIYS